ncbi:phosphopentomutase [Zooshikella marina]|uniref:phosphopentomutase n=1 Tax=Zooshikella ganghwensis TaxID=202772 RepID=UPI001BB09C89|nr:phosphopentomutase [Zooshikella ganghwensis]MBU2704380.1 phosphopentomutase [Zooshikella ganghwensis]
MKRAIILVLDSFGIGATEDADKFGDTGANTLGHIAAACANGQAEIEGRTGPLKLPNLSQLGLMHAAQESAGAFPQAVETQVNITGAYGYAKELSSGKDTPSGHWEIAGVPVLYDWGYFEPKENSFPQELLDEFITEAKVPGILGNCHASGTEIIKRLGEEHRQSGKPIVYTSADSVFQIACHEDSFGLERLYELCLIARKLCDKYNIGRIIARPFIGESPEEFQRTGNRRDYAVPPPSATVLDKLVAKGGDVISVGKIADIFAHQGITRKVKATGLEALFDATLTEMNQASDQSLIFTNFVDFDSSYGHRRDTAGYAKALEYFDQRLPELLAIMQDDDVLIITADHGCDPTWPGSDHTREHIPVLVYGKKVQPGSLGGRETFADIGQSLASYFSLESMEYGTSFLN